MRLGILCSSNPDMSFLVAVLKNPFHGVRHLRLDEWRWSLWDIDEDVESVIELAAIALECG